MRITTCAMILLSGGLCQLHAQMPKGKQHVQVGKVTIGKDNITRKSIGRMEAINTVDVKVPVEGIIQSISFKEGDTVTEGQTLFTIDPERYQATVQKEEAELEQVQAQLIYARNNYLRLEVLAMTTATTVKEKDTALANYKALEAAVKEAEANLKKARKDLEDCTIRAEITGRIGRINLSPGNYVTRGETLVTIKQQDPIYVRFPLSQSDVNGIFGGTEGIANTAKVELTLANGLKYKHDGKIKIIDNMLTSESDSYILWAEFKNEDQVLTPRGIGALKISTSTPSRRSNAKHMRQWHELYMCAHQFMNRVCMVPLTAVHYDENGAFVFTVDAAGKVARVNVTVGSVRDNLQTIYSGVTVGQTVITDGAHKIRVGDTVIGIEATQRSAAKTRQADSSTPALAVTTTTVTSMQDATVFKCHGARIEAINRVELRPLVQGLLLEQAENTAAEPQQEGKRKGRLVKEGQIVEKDTEIFHIDPVRYEAEVDAIHAQIEGLNVRIEDARKNYERDQNLLKRQADNNKEEKRKAASLNDVEKSKAKLDEEIAKKKAAEAALVIAKDDLKRCTIKAPMSGRLGRVYFTEGNYISDVKAPLATLVQVSPIYVRFFMSENEILSAFGSAQKLKEEAEVTLITAEGVPFEEKGKIHFADNVIKNSTDTQNIWAVFENTSGQLTPGGIVTIQITRKSDLKKPAVEKAAIQTDTAGRFVYTITDTGRAKKTRILCGKADPKTGLTPVFSGLKEGDVVITGPLAAIEEGTRVIAPAK